MVYVHIYMVYVVTCRGVPGICIYIWYMWLHVGGTWYMYIYMVYVVTCRGYLVYVYIYGICSYM